MGSLRALGVPVLALVAAVVLPTAVFLPVSSQAAAEEDARALTMDTLLAMSLDELLQVEVGVTSRRPTKLKHVAENVAIVTAEDIRALNANSLKDVLRTVTGIQVEATGGDFGSRGAVGIHASDYEHVLLLLDGVRLNDVDAGYPDTGGIPVQIIDRIEIVKGPASSAWGSALGGVINVVTRQAGTAGRPRGVLYGAYGTGPNHEFRADVAGRAGEAGYYLYGGTMDTDGLVDDRYFKNKSLYAKLTAQPADDATLTLTGGYWYPDYKAFDWPLADYSAFGDVQNQQVAANLDAGLSPRLRLNLDLYYRAQNWHNRNTTFYSDVLLSDQAWDNDLWGGNAGLTWVRGNHTMLFGAEYSRGENERTWRYPATPPFIWQTERRNDCALYFNDTITWRKLALIPGLRYDRLEIVDATDNDIVSPSLGATYALAEDTLLRATAARGFIKPAIGLTVGSSGYAGDPGLEPEDIWSLQAGIETTRFRKTHLKADLFYHRQDNTWYLDEALGVFTNGGVSERTGLEVNGETGLPGNITAALGLTYILMVPYREENDETYGLNVKLGYRDDWFGSLILFGRYYWWSENEMDPSGRNGNFLCELHYNRDLVTFADAGAVLNLFVSIRNLFNSSHYTHEAFVNPDRWVQAGLRLNF